VGTVKDRSWKTGVSSGQAKETLEQTTAASDMEMTSKESEGRRVDLCPGKAWGKGCDETDHLGGAAEAPAGGRQIRISPGDVVVTRHVCHSSITRLQVTSTVTAIARRRGSGRRASIGVDRQLPFGAAAVRQLWLPSFARWRIPASVI
jgi:hypothetical protein